MNRIIFSLVFLVACTIVQAQEAINFQKISLSEAKAQAKASGKLIFIDGYTSWCAPCKWMEGNVFNQTDAAKFYNANYINIKFDCEVGEGIDVAKHYNIRSFPTYLFLDAEGELMYRSQSRMETQDFIAEGKRALDPNFQIPTIRARYEAGERSPSFLAAYITTMTKVDPASTAEAKNALDEIADPSFLKSEAGWSIIELFGQSPKDKYGKFFMDNRPYFKGILSIEVFEKKEAHLMKYAMYDYIRTKDEAQFEEGLAYFSSKTDEASQVDAAMFKVEWIGAHGTDKEFIDYTNQLRKGLFKQEDERLSFIARRYSGKYGTGKEPSAKVLKQSYVLAKQAVALNENSYSNQGTFAEICISLKKKKEAVKAAEAARALAELETFKIVKIADALLARAQAI
ncbi:thioredoxin family protein [Sphingobacterium faecale]|uniref:Thioredoxin family protein n=1 Tax=Sphingobacterium faecale TaxID=2803775 RepID=A0ABS1R2X2_9SPHI|nr:thioredoxin family protein [Sphingobacterium faecale]MBL1408899.1 thioredoxin family protein [Sphingobacterium faecale]